MASALMDPSSGTRIRSIMMALLTNDIMEQSSRQSVTGRKGGENGGWDRELPTPTRISPHSRPDHFRLGILVWCSKPRILGWSAPERQGLTPAMDERERTAGRVPPGLVAPESRAHYRGDSPPMRHITPVRLPSTFHLLRLGKMRIGRSGMVVDPVHRRRDVRGAAGRSDPGGREPYQQTPPQKCRHPASSRSKNHADVRLSMVPRDRARSGGFPRRDERIPAPMGRSEGINAPTSL